MFKKLKDKIAEEVKSSPSRIQQLAQVAQAAVSSASSTTSESVPTNDNFFSITEEDTPQNSPHRPSSSSTPAKPINTTGKNVQSNAANNSTASLNNGTIPSTRVRKLSNSSMASDVSFRLPTYDAAAPAVFNLQSDLDTASEFEDGGGASGGAMSYGAQLDVISKEKLYDAYKKALDRYQKYRGRYTELVRRYRDLERDNSKARSVLVETQDKALRRISELREQCSLEQQAKAHLESALRLEMDEQDCVIKTLKTKLSLLGENPDEVLQNGRDSVSLVNVDTTNGFDPDATTDLIDISDGTASDSSRIAAGASIIINESEDKIKILEGQLSKLSEQIAEEKSKLIIRNEEFNVLNKKFDESQRKVRELIAREEENNILLAENKLMIHTELENKEKETKSLKQRLVQNESEHKQLVTEKDNLNKVLLKLKQEEAKSGAKVRDLIEDKRRLDAKVAELEREKSGLESDVKELQAKQIVGESERQTTLARHQAEVDKARALAVELQAKIAELESGAADQTTKEAADQLQTELNHVKVAHAEVSKRLSEQTDTVDKLKKEIEQLSQSLSEQTTALEDVQAEKVRLEQSLAAVEGDFSASSAENKTVAAAIQQRLEEEQAKTVQMEATIQNHAEAIGQLTASTQTLQADNTKLSDLVQQHEATIQTLTDTRDNLTHTTEGLQHQIESLKEVEDQIRVLTDEKVALATEIDATKAHCVTLKTANDDLHQQIASLTEEIKNVRVVNEKSESEAIVALQNSMKTSIDDLNEKLKRINGSNKTLQDQLKKSHKERAESQSESATLKAKVEALKHEKRDLQKTLEKEIRDKTELKNQVTNILQEIGRLEDELKLVKESHAEIATEKRALEEKTGKLKTAQQEARAKADKEQKLALDERVKEFEARIKQLEGDNSRLAEQNGLLEESNVRLQTTVRDVETAVNAESLRAQELGDQCAALRLELDSARDETARVQEKLKQSLDVHTELFNLKEQMEQDNRSLMDQLEITEKEKLCLLNTHETLQADLDGLKAQTKQHDALRHEKDTLTADCDRLRQEVDAVRAENQALAQAKQQLQEENSKLTARLEQFDAERAPLDREVDELRARLGDFDQQKIALHSSLQASNGERDELLQKVGDLERRLQHMDEVKIENEYLNMSIKQTEVDLSALKELNAGQSTELATHREKLQSQQCELYVLQEDRSKQSESFQKKDDEIEQLKGICQRSQTFNEELQNELKQLKQQFDGMKLINDELHKDIAQQQGKYDKALKELEGQKQMNVTQTDALRQQAAALEQKDADHKIALSQVEQKSAQLTELEAKLSEAAQAHSVALADQSEQLAEWQTKADGLQKEIDSSRAIIGDLNKDLNAHIERSESAEAQSVQLHSQIDALQAELADKTATPDNAEVLRRTNEQLQCEVAELKSSNERDVADLKNEIDELQSNARAYHELNTERQRDLDELRAANAALQQQIEQLKSEQVIQVVRVADTETAANAAGANRDEQLEALRAEKDDADSQLQKILNEVQDVSNRNLFLEQKCENYLILEQSNERLKLQNSKLSQQLDETLVSMQHAEGISANTEFEYLRNIMFQYLTNNINSNGSTLIKVIAAVLKFSPQQTQVVLEKEIQRKTVVGQIQNLL